MDLVAKYPALVTFIRDHVKSSQPIKGVELIVFVVKTAHDVDYSLKELNVGDLLDEMVKTGQLKEVEYTVGQRIKSLYFSANTSVNIIDHLRQEH